MVMVVYSKMGGSLEVGPNKS